MARYYGKVGYGSAVENSAGVWVDEITERSYYGDVIRNTQKPEPGESLNDDITVGNSISIISDQYAIQNISKIVYAEWSGERWTVTNVEVKSPRLILSLGSVYNGPTP